MRLLTLIAGYAAGLAVAMKYRKDTGASKLPEDIKKSTFNNIIDEVVDIHRDVFVDAKKLFDNKFGEVHSIEDLKGKIETVIDSFTSEVEAKIESLKTEWEEKKTEIQGILEGAYNEKITLLEESKKKALEFAGTALDTVEPWILQARKKLDAAYKKAKTNKTL
jgi:hypothetical protein